MIELLLQAEGALGLGLLDRAEQMYWQAIERDPRNAMAVVGLARVAIERGDDRTALAFGRRALGIDPENGAARRLTARLEEVLAYRGEEPEPEPASVSPPVSVGGVLAPVVGLPPAGGLPPAVRLPPVVGLPPVVPLPLVSVAAAPEPAEPPRRSLLDRLLRRG